MIHTEHLQRVRAGVVAAAWLIAVAVTSLIVFVAFALDLVEPDSVLAARLQMSAIAVGFFAGGLFAGLKAAEAPILHGVAMGLLSLPVWFVLNFVSAMFLPGFGWDALSANFAITLVLIQIVTAVLGARAGMRVVLKGRG